MDAERVLAFSSDELSGVIEIELFEGELQVGFYPGVIGRAGKVCLHKLEDACVFRLGVRKGAAEDVQGGLLMHGNDDVVNVRVWEIVRGVGEVGGRKIDFVG